MMGAYQEMPVQPEARYFPADDSLIVTPAEACPACGEHHKDVKFTPIGPATGHYEGTCPKTGRYIQLVMLRDQGERYIRPTFIAASAETDTPHVVEG